MRVWCRGGKHQKTTGARKIALLSMAYAAFFTLWMSAPAQAQLVATPGAPTAFGLPDGVLAISQSGSYSTRNRRGLAPTRFDGSSAVTYGFGDPVDGIGYHIGATITSTRRYGRSGYLSWGAYKLFQRDDRGVYAVAANLDYVGRWGEGREMRPSGNLLASYMTGFGENLGLVTLGVANNTRFDRRIVGVFGLGVGVTERSSLSVAQMGSRTTLGLTTAPAILQGFTLSAGLSRDWSSKTDMLAVDIGRNFTLRR